MAAGAIEVPARLMLIGPSHSGKSTLIKQLIRFRAQVFDQPHPQRVIYCNAVLDGRAAYLEELRQSVAAEAEAEVGGDDSLWITDTIPSIDEVKSFADGQPLLLVVDDVLSHSAEATSNLVPLFTLHSHHSGLSVVLATQTAFLQNQRLDLVTLSRQATGIFLTSQRSDLQQLRMLNSRLFPEKKHWLSSCLTTAYDDFGLPYIYVNVFPFSKIPRRLMVYTALFPDEQAKLKVPSPVFFALE